MRGGSDLDSLRAEKAENPKESRQHRKSEQMNNFNKVLSIVILFSIVALGELSPFNRDSISYARTNSKEKIYNVEFVTECFTMTFHIIGAKIVFPIGGDKKGNFHINPVSVPGVINIKDIDGGSEVSVATPAGGGRCVVAVQVQLPKDKTNFSLTMDGGATPKQVALHATVQGLSEVTITNPGDTKLVTVR